MVDAAASVREAGFAVVRLQVRHLVENLGSVEAGGEKIEHVADTDTHPPHARTASALRGVDGDTVKQRGHV